MKMFQFKKTIFVSFLLFLFMSIPVSASQIINHDIVVDILDSGVSKTSVELGYDTLTTNEIYYFVFAQIDSLEAYDDYGILLCNMNRFSYGTQITCKPNTEDVSNYSVSFEFNMLGLRSLYGDSFLFSYDYSLKIPTDKYSIEFVLPTGTAIVSDVDSISSVFPEDAIVGSTTDGRHITVKWVEENPSLGSDHSYRVRYEEVVQIYSNAWFYPVVLGLLSLIVLMSFMLVRGRKAKRIKTVLSVLHEGERKVIELLIGHENKCNQRFLVKETGFSKAKMSRIVFDLSERGLITKTRRGRTNIIELVDKK